MSKTLEEIKYCPSIFFNASKLINCCAGGEVGCATGSEINLLKFSYYTKVFGKISFPA